MFTNGWVDGWMCVFGGGADREIYRGIDEGHGATDEDGEKWSEKEREME